MGYFFQWQPVLYLLFVHAARRIGWRGVPGHILWECFVSRFYQPKSWVCWVGITQTVLFLVIFKYRNFLTGLWWPDPSHNPLYWKNSFLPLGISFFTFEFVHYAVDRYRNKIASGSVGEYLAFILFFPTMVAGPIKRYEDFLPKLRAVTRECLPVDRGQEIRNRRFLRGFFGILRHRHSQNSAMLVRAYGQSKFSGT